jgi:hypothetical protein
MHGPRSAHGLGLRSDPMGGTVGWPAHAHGSAAQRDRTVTTHYRRTVARPVRLANGLPDNEVDWESVAKLLASRWAW